MQTQYNGWTNRETWLLNLWISNDEGLYTTWNETARNLIASDRETALGCLADALRDDLEDECCRVAPDAGLISDLLSHARMEINYFEVARHLIQDNTEDEA